MAKINIFKDTIPLKEAKRFDSLLLFVLQQYPEINYFTAVNTASNKLQEISFYSFSVNPIKEIIKNG